jgi:hypothetical protein
MSVLPACCLAQTRVATDLPTDRPRSVFVPVFTEREKDVGSVYLKKWSRGYIVLWNQKRIPEQSEYLLFNFDKMKNLIFSMDQFGKQSSYPVDSVLSFEIVENGVIYSFEKFPGSVLAIT